MHLNESVKFIISRLEENGHRADIVGGPVRDFLRGVIPHDYDITTSATPDEIKSAFSNCKTVDTGIKHGTVTVVLDKEPYEITTYRIDGDYLDSRHPESVSFTKNIAEDLARRDFTVNAISFNPRDGITDLYGGREDIEKKIIRAVGDPEKRFSEDALRILRGLRFSATLGFEIEEKTAEALRNKSCLLKNISAERIYTEWKKLLSGDFAYDVIKEFSDVIAVFIPELENLKLPEKTRFAKEFLIREAQIFALSSKTPDTDFESAMLRLKTDTATRTLGIKILENTGKYTLNTLGDAGIMLMHLGKEAALATAELDIALGKSNEEEKALIEEYIDKKLPYRLADLAVSGEDITALGIKGKQIGDTLALLLSLVAAGKLLNDKNILIEYVKTQNM